MSIMRNAMMQDPLMGMQSLYNRGGAVYRQTGGDAITPGTPTIPNLPGTTAHEALNESIAAGEGPTIAEGATPEEINKAYIEWASNPANIPDYYGGATVAEFDPLQLEAFASKENTASQLDALNKQQLDYYQGILSGTSPHLQRAADTAAQTTSNAFFGAGTPGSARGQYAGALAAQDAVRANRQNALNALGSERGNLTGAADIVSGVGEDRRKLSQDVIDEDIKRFNYCLLYTSPSPRDS